MKIVIIGGFLGGGKTTVLNHLLAESLKESLKPAVIMNQTLYLLNVVGLQNQSLS